MILMYMNGSIINLIYYDIFKPFNKLIDSKINFFNLSTESTENLLCTYIYLYLHTYFPLQMKRVLLGKHDLNYNKLRIMTVYLT